MKQIYKILIIGVVVWTIIFMVLPGIAEARTITVNNANPDPYLVISDHPLRTYAYQGISSFNVDDGDMFALIPSVKTYEYKYVTFDPETIISSKTFITFAYSDIFIEIRDMHYDDEV